MAKWAYFAKKEFPKVVRELRLPCAARVLVTGMASCPTHGQVLGELTRTCVTCRDSAWAEVARRYVAQGRPVPSTPTDPKEVSMSTSEVVEGELLPAVYEDTPVPSTLFGTSDPTLALEKMALMARLLVDVVRDRKLVMKISGNEYLLAPGWAVLAGMTGLSPYTVWVKPLEDGTGYTARVEVRRVADGAVISAAEQVCTKSERKWSHAEEHALMGMAQTRASSRALKGPLQQIVELAGYKGTPAEEMVEEPKAPERDTAAVTPGKIPDKVKPTKEQGVRVRELIAELTKTTPDVDWKQRAQDIAGQPWDMFTGAMAAIVIAKLEAELERDDVEQEEAAQR